MTRNCRDSFQTPGARGALVCLDLFSGLGGAHAAMTDRGWRVVSVELLERFKPSIVADVAHLPLAPFPVDLLWASPPCTAYSRLSQAGLYPNEPPPDLSLYHASRRVIEQFQPRYWVIENVRGAARWWGQPDYRFESRLLWTNIPIIGQLSGEYLKSVRKGDPGGLRKDRSWLRARIPYAISEIVASAVEALT